MKKKIPSIYFTTNYSLCKKNFNFAKYENIICQLYAAVVHKWVT